MSKCIHHIRPRTLAMMIVLWSTSLCASGVLSSTALAAPSQSAFKVTYTNPYIPSYVTQDSTRVDSLRYDKTPLRATIESDDIIKKFKEDPDFNYVEELPEDNFYTRLKQKLKEAYASFIRWLMGGSEAVGFWGFMVKLLPYLLVIGLLVFFVWLILRIDNGALLGSGTKLGQVQFSDDQELIEYEDIPTLIEQALKTGNFRLAVRYYYLLTLQRLTQKEHIHWQVQKTNHDYIFELQDPQIKQGFRHLTDVYDHIWYGNFSVDASAFAKAETAFKNLLNKL